MRDNVDKVADIFVILVAATLVVLKLTGVITISWFWLFSPIIFLFGLGLLFGAVLTISCLINTWYLEYKKEKRK
jgi:hypothetical protein